MRLGDICVLEDSKCRAVEENEWPDGLWILVCYSGNISGADLPEPFFRVSLSSALTGNLVFSQNFSGAAVYISRSMAERFGCPDGLIEILQNSGGSIAGTMSVTESSVIKRYIYLLKGCDFSSGGDLTEAANLAMALFCHLAVTVQKVKK